MANNDILEQNFDIFKSQYSLEAEQSVLGAILINSDCLNKVAEILIHSDYFYLANHKVIYSIMLDLFTLGQPVDYITVLNKIKSIYSIPLTIMYTIQLNEKGTRTIEISEENLQTIEKYLLFRDLVDSTGYVTEAVLDKLRLNIRSLIAHQTENSKDLLDLCIDVIYHDSMKAFGLKNLILLYLDWKQNQAAEPTE